MNELLEILAKFLSSEFFTILASISSIISLILTFYVFLDVRKIKSYYLFAARVPNLIEKLQQNASNLSDYLDNFEQFSSKIEEELAEAEVIVESLSKRIDGDAKKSTEKLIKHMQEYNSREKNRDSVWKIYLDIRRVVGRINEIQEDRKWEV